MTITFEPTAYFKAATQEYSNFDQFEDRVRQICSSSTELHRATYALRVGLFDQTLDDFNRYYQPPEARALATKKLLAIPRAFIKMATAVIYLARVYFWAIPLSLICWNDRFYISNVEVVVLNVVEAYGHLESLFNDRKGEFWVQYAGFQKNYLHLSGTLKPDRVVVTVKTANSQGNDSLASLQKVLDQMGLDTFITHLQARQTDPLYYPDAFRPFLDSGVLEHKWHKKTLPMIRTKYIAKLDLLKLTKEEILQVFAISRSELFRLSNTQAKNIWAGHDQSHIFFLLMHQFNRLGSARLSKVPTAQIQRALELDLLPEEVIDLLSDEQFKNLELTSLPTAVIDTLFSNIRKEKFSLLSPIQLRNALKAHVLSPELFDRITEKQLKGLDMTDFTEDQLTHLFRGFDPVIDYYVGARQRKIDAPTPPSAIYDPRKLQSYRTAIKRFELLTHRKYQRHPLSFSIKPLDQQAVAFEGMRFLNAFWGKYSSDPRFENHRLMELHQDLRGEINSYVVAASRQM